MESLLPYGVMDGQRLRELRTIAGLSMEEVAVAAGTSRFAVRDVEERDKVGPRAARRYLTAIASVVRTRAAVLEELEALMAEMGGSLTNRAA